MFSNRLLRHSTAGWCATLLVAAVIVIAFYNQTKVFTPDNFGIGPSRVPRITLEDGYLVKYRPESLDSAKLIALGRLMGMNSFQMPKSGVAYFENAVPQNVVDQVVAAFEKNKDESARSSEPWRFYVRKRMHWLRLSGLIAVALLVALAIQGLASFDSPQHMKS